MLKLSAGSPEFNQTTKTNIIIIIIIIIVLTFYKLESFLSLIFFLGILLNFQTFPQVKGITAKRKL